MRRITNSTALPSRYFGTHRQCFAAFRLTWLAYSDGRKREHCSVRKDRIIVASTCRRSVQFGCYITWPWMANCVSVMIKMLPLFNFTICLVEAGWRPSFIHVYHSTSCTVYNPGDYVLFRHVYNMVCCGNARQFLKLEQFSFFGRFVFLHLRGR